jgi:hypothetical protein
MGEFSSKIKRGKPFLSNGISLSEEDFASFLLTFLLDFAKKSG